jgi:hypothetical protein
VCGNTREIRIDMTSSRTPLIRAGWGNILLFFAMIASYMSDGLLADLQAPFLYRALCTVIVWIAFLVLYLRCVSQVRIIEGGELIIENPLRRRRMDLARMERIRICTIPMSKTAGLWITARGKTLPAFYFFVAAYTNCGWFEETIDKLSGVLKNHGVAS